MSATRGLQSNAWVQDDAARIATAEFESLSRKAADEKDTEASRVLRQLAKVAERRAKHHQTLAAAYRAIASNGAHEWLK